jgi:tetratricopeptide (TPR) repeat protein
MPLVDPNASFDVAARHLFRHLTDSKQLRRNPLVRRFFEGGAAGRFTHANERATLALIRDLVVRGGEQYGSSEVAGSVQREAAYRRHTIVTEHCLEGRPLESVAAELGISMRQCYRERVEAMHRIAEYVGSYEDRPKTDVESILSEFRLRMDRAACRAEVGDVDQALRDYDDIVASDPSREHKVEALCKRAEALLAPGDFQQCEASLVQAQGLLRTGPLLTDVADAAMLAHVELVRSKVCWSTGKFDEDALALGRALECIDPVLPGAGDRVLELYAEVLLEFCERFRTRGEFRRAHEYLRRAEAALGSVRMPTPARRFDAMVESWSLGARGVQFEGSSTRHHSRYEALAELSALALSAASPRRSIRLAQAFMQHHADVGHQEAASEWAQRALLMAKQHHERRLLASVSLSVADWASVTPQRIQVPSLLRAADGVFPKGSPDWILLHGLWAAYALQSKQYREALAGAMEVERALGSMGNVRFQAATRTVIALAAHALGKQSEAKEQVHSALEVIDNYGTPWTRQQAYRAAATITGDQQYRRKANEVRQSLRA